MQNLIFLRLIFRDFPKSFLPSPAQLALYRRNCANSMIVCLRIAVCSVNMKNADCSRIG